MRILLLVGALALIAATLASWWLIRRGLRPVDRMVDTAAAIAAGDLGRRVPDADPRTELGRLGGALNEMLHQIERAIHARTASEERLRRFVADAAHELRTPLTSLRGYAELYRQGALVGENGVANAMRRIEAEGARMARLVDDMLLLARLDQQRGIERRPVDVVALVREAAEDFRAVAPDRPLTETIDGEAIVTGDPARLRQVLDNLLTNARTHAPAGTAVHLSVAREGDQVAIAVADEGRGIPAEDRAKVFERFWRADPARGRGGTGLGLAIVASLVAAHGGTVTVDGPPGKGARFTVRLPLISRTRERPRLQRGTDDGRRQVPPEPVPQPIQPLPEV
jgi:two-component system OmpR family sensor kinase